MPTCEACWDQAWTEARFGPESQVEAYHRLLLENQGKPGHNPDATMLGGEPEEDRDE